MHTNTTLEVLEGFKCRLIAGRYYLYSDTRIECIGEKYEKYSSFSYFFFVFYCIGMPLTLFFYLKKYSITRKTKFRFISLGFKKRFWYWEFVILLRKICLIFTVTARVELQPLIGAIIILIAIHLHLVFRPFHPANPILRNFETLSLIISFITCIFGIFFVSDSLTDVEFYSIAYILFFINLFCLFGFIYYIGYYIKSTEDVIGNAKRSISRFVRSSFSLQASYWDEGERSSNKNMVRMDDDKL